MFFTLFFCFFLILPGSVHTILFYCCCLLETSCCCMFRHLLYVNSFIIFMRRTLKRNLKFSSRKIFTCLPSGHYTLRADGSTCVDLVEDCKKAISVHFYVAIKSIQNKKNRIAVLIMFNCSHYKLHACICIKLSRRRPARSLSFARTASSAETLDVCQKEVIR